MTLRLLHLTSISLLLGACSKEQVTSAPDGSLMSSAQQRITAFHSGAQKSGATLRVVYFHPSDREPLPGYEERLDRVLKDVSDFYRDGMQRFGLPCDGLPLELENGRLKLHLVKGKHPAKHYSYSSGTQTVAEIRDAVKGTFDLSQEHVLIMHGLCKREPDGRFVFDAPYYGSGSAKAGFCHAADCELLDPLLLKDSKPMVYTEHYYPRVETTVGGFNTSYLGGVAHELGHGLFLFHEAGMAEERTQGSSLMGSGNHRYRNDVRGGKNTAFLAKATALHLMSHPLITGSNRGRSKDIKASFKEMEWRPDGRVMHVRGRVESAIPGYAAVAYVWRHDRTDHSAQPFPTLLDEEGRFDIALSGIRPGAYKARITTFHVNGAAHWENHSFGFDATDTPRSPWVVEQAEKAVLTRGKNAAALLTDAAIAQASDADQRLLHILRKAAQPSTPVDLSTMSETTFSLSDVHWQEAKVGWGQPARNHHWFDERIQDGVFLLLGGEVFAKGLYAHSPSRYVFDLGAKFQSFTATIGIRDHAPVMGTAVFRVLGDGKELYRSPMLRSGGREKVKVRVAGVRTLELISDGGEGHNHGSWAIWCAPMVER